MVVLLGKQAANQACVSNPHSPPRTTGSVTDTNTLSERKRREGGPGRAGGGGGRVGESGRVC